MATSDIISDIMTKIASAAYGDIGPNDTAERSYNGRSIKTRTQDLIMQFPLLVSENINIKNVAKLAEGFEAENAILVKLLLQNDLGSLTSDLSTGNTSQVLRKIHTNINSDPLMECQRIVEANLKQLIPIEDKFNPWSLNESTLPKYLREFYSTYTDENETKTSKHDSEIIDDIDDRGRVIHVKKTDDEDHISSSGRTTSIEFTNKNPFDPKMFEKINKLSPTFIEMEIHVAEYGNEVHKSKQTVGKQINFNNDTNKRNKSTRDIKIIFGVKCVVHPLKSDDIIHNITSSFRNSSLFKLIKWTTGEYGFVQGIGEVIFDYSRMKELGTQASKTSNYWWFKLKKLKNANRSKFFTNNKNQPTKTATLILTKDEVDHIAREYKIDLTQTKTAYKLLNELFLLNFGYIDETTETVYLFDEVSKTYLVKELSEFEGKKKSKPIDVDDIKSLFGR